MYLFGWKTNNFNTVWILWIKLNFVYIAEFYFFNISKLKHQFKNVGRLIKTIFVRKQPQIHYGKNINATQTLSHSLEKHLFKLPYFNVYFCCFFFKENPKKSI